MNGLLQGFPSTDALQRSRRIAARLRAASACPPCKRIKQKCGDMRPCARCKRLAREEDCVPQDIQDIQEIEPPFAYPLHYFDLRVDANPPRNLILRYDWSLRTVMIYWHSGYSCNLVSNIFNSMPEQLSSLMGSVSMSLQRRDSSTICSQVSEDQNAVARNTYDRSVPTEEALLWDKQEIYGFMEIGLDPISKQRTHIIMNTRFANIHGFHKEELYARFANHDADLQRTDIDNLLMMLDGLHHMLDDSKAASVERYYRMHSRGRPLLVWSLWGKAFNALGQVYKARIPPPAAARHGAVAHSACRALWRPTR